MSTTAWPATELLAMKDRVEVLTGQVRTIKTQIDSIRLRIDELQRLPHRDRRRIARILHGRYIQTRKVRRVIVKVASYLHAIDDDELVDLARHVRKAVLTSREPSLPTEWDNSRSRLSQPLVAIHAAPTTRRGPPPISA